jgi:hypothetical protein
MNEMGRMGFEEIEPLRMRIANEFIERFPKARKRSVGV